MKKTNKTFRNTLNFLERIFMGIKISVLFGIALIVIAIASRCSAGTLEAAPYAIFPTGEDVNQGYGIQFSYVADSGFYPYFSYDLNPVDYMGCDMGIVNLVSLGGGYTKTWRKGNHGIRFFIDGGWYNPHNSDLERTEITSRQKLISSRCQKPVYMTVNDITTTKLKHKDGFGGKAGLGYSYSLNERFTANLSGGYRYLELERNDGKQDFSGFLGMIVFRLVF